MDIGNEYWRDELDSRPVLVTIRCATYNQEKYIRDALDGFVKQKTDFRFEAIVHDDASTDSTAEIIREYAEKYPSIIKPIYEIENQFSKGRNSLSRIMQAHTRGKYIAYCEGDDYWIDELKLQKQVDALESNPSATLAYSRAWEMNDKDKVLDHSTGGKVPSLEALVRQNYIPTATAMVRKSIYEKYLEEIGMNQGWLVGDYPIWLYCMIKGDIIYSDDITTVYRVLDESAFHTKSFDRMMRITNSVIDIKDFFNKKYKITDQKELDRYNDIERFQISFKYKKHREVSKYYRIIKPKNKFIHLKYMVSAFSLNDLYTYICEKRKVRIGK